MRLSLMSFVCVCLLAATAQAREIVISALGDSLFAGYGLGPENAFPLLLEQKLKAAGYEVRIYNDGISGDVTAGGLARLDAVLAQKPDIALVELGANDMRQGFPPEQTRANLDGILSQLHAAHIKLLVMGQKAPITLGRKYTQAYDPIFCDLARQYGGLCYPFFLEGVYGHPDLVQLDGIHPNADGVKIMVDKVYPQVVELLKRN